MHLVIKQGEKIVEKFEFDEGPIHIGRMAANQVCLDSKSVSKNHAIIFNLGDGQWVLEDLDSSNKTYLNGRAIHKTDVKTGDVIGICDFNIETNFEEPLVAEEPADDTVAEVRADETIDIEDIEETIELEETEQIPDTEVVVKSSGALEFGSHKSAEARKSTAMLAHDAQVIARKPGAEKPSPIRFPGERADDFLEVTNKISKADSLDDILQTLQNTLTKQFGAYQVWCALRNEPSGPMTAHGGKDREGKALELDDIKLHEKITEAIEDGEFLLFVFSRDPEQDDRTTVRSLLMAPIVSPSSCFGAVYISNSFIDDHYNLGDLDYLMMVTIHTATVLENLI